MKSDSTHQIVEAVRKVRSGGLFARPEILESLAERMVSGAAWRSADPVESLSDRELEVFELLGQGYETRRVAEMLGLNIKTIQAFCARIKEKLQLANASELLREAVLWSDQALSK